MRSNATINNALITPIGVGLALTISAFSLILLLNNEYILNGYLNPNPDAIQYLRLAENWETKHIYSRSNDAKGEADMLRTPGYPLLLILTRARVHVWVTYFIQCFMFLCVIFFVHKITQRCFGRLPAKIAGIFCATDLLLLSSCFFLMTEIAYIFFTLLSLLILRWPTFEDNASPLSIKQCTLGGLCLGFSALIRPTGLYYPIILLIGLIPLSLEHQSYKKNWKQISVILIMFLLCIVPWIYRNNVVLGVARFTTIDKHNLVYFVGAGAYQIHFDIEREDAQRRIEKEFDLPSYQTLQNHWVSDEKIKVLYERVNNRAHAVVLKYPEELIKSCAIGIAKASIAHNMNDLAYLSNGQWFSVSEFERNSVWLYPFFAFQTVHTCIACLLAAFGIYAARKYSISRSAILCIIGTTAYFYLTIAMFGIDAVARSRINTVWIIYILAGIGLGSILDSLSNGETAEDNFKSISKITDIPPKFGIKQQDA